MLIKIICGENFISDEVASTKLECNIEIFRKLKDDRYENKGDITYKQIYKENLPTKSQDLILKEIKNDEKVSLYKRVFLGIDKECDEKAQISQEKNEKLESNQNSEVTLLYIETGFIIFIYLIATIGMILHTFCKFSIGDCYVNTMGISSFIMGIMIFISMICRSVFISRIIKNSSLDYDCSDYITNEIINTENKNTKSFIIYTAINLGVDVIFLIFNDIAFIFALRDYRKTKSNYDYLRFNH
jgi:uncharacterized membrane protein